MNDRLPNPTAGWVKPMSDCACRGQHSPECELMKIVASEKVMHGE